MSVIIDGGAGITFPDTVQQTNGMTMTGGNPRYYAARAWMNYKGTSTRFIRASVNIASVSRSAFDAGRFTVTFSTAMPDANYAIVASAGSSGTTLTASLYGTPTTTAFELQVSTVSGTYTDPDYLHVAVFR